jgi:hypothetical protein
MRTPAHEAALRNFLQIASNREGGIASSLRQGRRTAYIRAHNDELYSATGPFASFERNSPATTQRALAEVIRAAQEHFNRGHSNAGGAAHDSPPEWARMLFPIFNGVSQRDQTRRGHAVNVHTLVGAQGPIGEDGNNNTERVQLRTETSPNDGGPALRQQLVNHPIEWDERLIEGRNDNANQVRPPNPPHRRRRGRNHHRNAHLEDYLLHQRADNEDAGRHDDDIQRGFRSLEMLVDCINQAIVHPHLPRGTPEELFIQIRNLENERRSLHDRPELLADNGVALSILRRELREMNDTMDNETNGGGESSADEN